MKNTIAYDRYLRQKLAELHDLVSSDILNMTNKVMDYASSFNPIAKDLLKSMSQLATDLRITLENANDLKANLVYN